MGAHQLRYVLLEHFGAPDDPRGCHLDLLLEDGDSCRSWRLDAIPGLNGPAVRATALPPHRLVWLDRQAAAVSGGRGWARRVVGGAMAAPLALRPLAPIHVLLSGLEHRSARAGGAGSAGRSMPPAAQRHAFEDEDFRSSANFDTLTAVAPVGSYQSGRANAVQVLRRGDDNPS